MKAIILKMAMASLVLGSLSQSMAFAQSAQEGRQTQQPQNAAQNVLPPPGVEVEPRIAQPSDNVSPVNVGEMAVGGGLSERGGVIYGALGLNVAGNGQVLQQSSLNLATRIGGVRGRMNFDATVAPLRLARDGVTTDPHGRFDIVFVPLQLNAQYTYTNERTGGTGPSHVLVSAPIRFGQDIQVDGHRVSVGALAGPVSGVTCNAGDCRAIPFGANFGADLGLVFGIDSRNAIRIAGNIAAIVSSLPRAGVRGEAQIAYLHRTQNNPRDYFFISVNGGGNFIPLGAVSDATVRNDDVGVVSGTLNIGYSGENPVPVRARPERPVANQQAR